LYVLYLCDSGYSSLGRADLNEIATEDGEGFEDDIPEEEDEEEVFDEKEVASKFIRVLTHEEENFFVVFVELGVATRNVQFLIVNDRTEIEMSYTVPRPVDGLFHQAGIESATKVAEAEDIFEVFYFAPSKTLTGKHEEILFKEDQVPTWMIFKYYLEEPMPQVPVKFNLNFSTFDSNNNNNNKKAT
jgi:hypothetical protein